MNQTKGTTVHRHQIAPCMKYVQTILPTEGYFYLYGIHFMAIASAHHLLPHQLHHKPCTKLNPFHISLPFISTAQFKNDIHVFICLLIRFYQ